MVKRPVMCEYYCAACEACTGRACEVENDPYVEGNVWMDLMPAGWHPLPDANGSVSWCLCDTCSLTPDESRVVAALRHTNFRFAGVEG